MFKNKNTRALAAVLEVLENQLTISGLIEKDTEATVQKFYQVKIKHWVFYFKCQMSLLIQTIHPVLGMIWVSYPIPIPKYPFLQTL